MLERISIKKHLFILLSVILIISLVGCVEDNSYKNVYQEQNVDNDVVDAIIVPDNSLEVPESIVLRNVSIPENATYEIVHNYDISAHIDDVELIVSYNGKFGTHITTYRYSYQHNQSNDLWSLISGNNGMLSDVVTLSEEGYERNSYFFGEFSQYHDGGYSLTVKDIDLENMKVTIDYLITFYDNSSVLYSEETFNLYTTNDGKICFSIPYNRSLVVMFEVIFAFDLDKGIYAV